MGLLEEPVAPTLEVLVLNGATELCLKLNKENSFNIGIQRNLKKHENNKTKKNTLLHTYVMNE